MKNKNTNQKKINLITLLKRFRLYLVTILVSVIAAFSLIAIRNSISAFYKKSIKNMKDLQWEMVHSHITLINNGVKIMLEEKTEAIEKEMRQELNLKHLKYCLEKGLYYPDLNLILRKYLQKDIFSKANMNSNNNGIFVICNGYVIANYSHDKLISPLPIYDKTMHLYKIEDQINQNFVNKAGSLNTLNKIENQQTEGFLLWQARDNDDDISLVENISEEYLRKVFEEHGISGLESFGILNVSYITEYGNIFNEFDENSNTSNKIIIISRYSITDYFKSKNLYLFNYLDTQDIKKEYDLIIFNLNMFQIILYFTILYYLTILIININVYVEEYNNSLDNDIDTSNK